MKIRIFGLRLLLAVSESAHASATAWQPKAVNTQIPLWPGAPPDATAMPEAEYPLTTRKLPAGRPVITASNVSHITMTVYAPAGINTGAAVVVFPGGESKWAFQGLEVGDLTHV